MDEVVTIKAFPTKGLSPEAIKEIHEELGAMKTLGVFSVKTEVIQDLTR